MKQEYESYGKKIISFSAAILGSILLYIILHEGGHALLVLLFGGEVTEFNIPNAHITVRGDFLYWQHAYISLAGTATPLFFWYVMMLFIPRAVAGFLQEFRSFFSVLILATFLNWIFVPFFYLVERAPVGEDVTNYLRYSGFSPLIVSVIAVLIFLFNLGLFLYKSRGTMINKMSQDKGNN